MGTMAPPQQTGFDAAKFYLWLKGLESKVNNLLREVDLIKNDFIRKNDDLRRDVKTLNEELLELKREQEKTLQKMDLIINELKQTAGVEEVQTLKRYVELWNPMTFVTQRDLERAGKLKMEEKTTGKEPPALLPAKPKGKEFKSGGVY